MIMRRVISSVEVEVLERLRSKWLLLVVLGVVVALVGVMAIGSAFVATLSSIVVFGLLLMAGGVVQVVCSFLTRGWSAFFVLLLVGIFQIFVGGLLIDHPLGAAAGLTLMLAMAFVAGGVTRLVFSAFNEFSGRGWVALNGLVTLILGIMIWRQWPESSLWVIGLFVGIDLLLSGIAWVMLGITVKASVPGRATQSTAQPVAV
jgi:uncharacterized membrane protein HdeD (DUF308 family)